MAKCVVIGGGIAGLSSAAFLSKNGHTVDLYEASPKLGGRTYSFFHNEQQEEIDNGQHILMGCYHNTFEFLETIKSFHLLEFQKNLKVNFVKKGKVYLLNADRFFYPINLLLAFINFEPLSSPDKKQVIKLFLKLIFTKPKKFDSISSKEYLRRNGQSAEAIENFWEILHVGTMNCKLGDSSAELFVRVLKEIFLTGNRSTKIVLPGGRLSKVFCEGARTLIEQHSGRINLSEKIQKLEFNADGDVVKIISNKNEIENFENVVLAIPPHQIEPLFRNSNIDYELPEFKYSPILNIHLWLYENNFTERFYGLINSGIHWVFNNETHLTLTTSNATDLINKNEKEIYNYALIELEKNFSFFKKESVKDFFVIKEKRATFLPTIKNSIERKKLLFGFNNLRIAGDWTNTELPSTIESAVKSGRNIADNLS